MPVLSTGDVPILNFDPTVVADGYDPFAMIEDVFALNRIYFLFEDGREAMQVYDGTELKEASGIAPSALPTVNAVAPSGAGDTGQRWYTITYYDSEADVETGPAADEDSISDDLYQGVALVAQDADVVIANPPASHARFDKARVYRNLKPLTDMYLLGDIAINPGGGGTVTFADTFAVDDDELATKKRLSLRKRFYSEGLPPAGYTGMFFDGRLFTVDPDRRNVVCYSEANLPEDFPTDNEVFVLPSQQDPAPEIKALRPNNGQRYIYTRKGIYHLYGSAPPYGVRCVVAGIGADSTYSTKFVDGVGVIFCSDDKMYVHLGGSDVRPLGVQRSFPDRNPLGDLYQETDPGRRKHSDLLVYTEQSSILAAMGVNGEAVNQRVFVWNYSENEWSVWNRPVQRFGYWALPNGLEWPVFADELGVVLQMDVGDSERVFTGDLTTAVASAGRSTVLYDNVGPPAVAVDTVKGCPLLILDADSGIVYRNRVWSQSSQGTIVLIHPWTTLPVDTQRIEVGSIEFAYETGYFTLFPDRTQASIDRLFAQIVKQAGGTMRLLCASDQEATLRLVDGAVPLDVVQFLRAFKERGSVFKVRFENTAPDEPVGIVAWQMDVTKKSHRV